MSIRDKILALLGKTVENGCTEEEAMAAAAKAKELMEKYGEQVMAEPYEIHLQNAYANSLEMHIIERLTPGVSAYCRVSPIYAPYKAGMQFFGPESATVFAEWLLPSLLDFVLRATEEHMKEYPRGLGIGDTKREKLSFAIGCAHRISERMRAEAGPWDNRTHLAKYEELKGGKLKKGHMRSTNVKNSAIEAGKVAGDGARWDRPVNAGGEVRRLT